MTLARIGVLSLLSLALGAGIAGLAGSGSLLGVLTQAVIYAIFALGVGVLLRQSGLVSFGHALFFGAAGYGMGVVLALDWMPAEAAIPVVLLAIGVLAFLIGLVIVRVPGIAFGMLTLAIGQMAYLLAFRARGLTGGADGMGIHWPATLFGYSQSALLKPATVFLIAWVSMVLTTVLLLFILRTRFGAITEAIRDNEERARFIGIGTTAPRAAVYALSAVVAGIAGILSSLNTGFVSPENLHWSVSAITLLMVIVGGFEKLAGPIIGAIVYVMFKDLLGGYATHSMALFGATLIAVIVFSPHGIAGALERLCMRLRHGPGVRRESV
ncbi:branched-chain amino acid ABC transporter permease [Verminephrobacter eiseniae]|uniref:branched-chain amino acid ABC transporter permease n=1 Tax=Verminephrobacter eiseniae TaxID=364317 RepID=UPI00223707C4|nr:branched-chain amino acid ABC transporter permease [Verminephrobacter eiseniae]MCW5285326.1 branched-chain amino acid ABC transporter permease [Verminephrobacter eiseniae]MCW5303034.1 branched-chain amino acid ABC transporter permease [Verminephrobacter eiseniae]MCW8179644.1 branched-chain amino acid ABC transporter permease [Verminephrobacter eiseniae]MCW8190470.1 branched-chain amino acid ABC transporter permease [Verminephrobacter eiseniae]